MAGNEVFRMRMKSERKINNITLKDIAIALDVKEATVQRYESGDIKTVPYDSIVGMANMFGCSPAYLMGWENKKEESNPSAKEDAELLKKYHLLDDEQKQVVIKMIDMLLHK